MKNLTRIMPLFFTCAFIFYSTIISSTITKTGNKTVAVLVLPNQGSSYYAFGTFGHNIGGKYSSVAQEKEVARTLYSFDISSIPANAAINSASLNISFSDYANSYKATITFADSKSNATDIWTEIGDASVFVSDITYGVGGGYSNSSLKNDLQTFVGSSNYYLGVFSSNGENVTNSYAIVDLELIIDYTVPPSVVNITAQNNFINGTIKVGVNETASQKISPYSFTATVGNTVNVEAQEQSYGGYNWIWNDTEAPVNPSQWDKITAGGSKSIKSQNTSYNFTAAENDNNSIYEAGLRKICNVNFQNNLVGFSSYGSVTVNGTSYNSPTSQFPVVEQNAINATATSMYYSVNGITYYFSKWNDGSTANPRTFYPGTNASYTANFVGIPNATYMNITLNYSESGQPVRLNWNDHPNANVTQYKVYRGAKVEGNFTNPVVLATLNRGTTSYTDYSYIVGGSNPGSVAYDVVPYYATEGTWGYVGQNIITASPGRARISTNENALAQAIANEIPTEYSIGNFPNPFNPTTKIKYQLPEAGVVTLKVYDILGREVAELVNENKPAGYYEVNFDASRLTSGVYIYTITAGKYTESKKMILAK